MNTAISQLPAREQSDLQHITKKIVGILNPEFIYCYGSRRLTAFRMSCFTQPQFTETRQYSYDIVIILSDQERRSNKEIFSLLKKATTYYFQVNTILHRRNYVFTELLEGNFFFSWLLRTGILLHSRDKLPVMGLHSIKQKGDNVFYPETLSQVRQLLVEATTCLKKAIEYNDEKRVLQALSQLSRSFEYALRSLLLGCIGYQPFATSLYALLNYTLNFTPFAKGVFPANTREEARLLRLVSGNRAETEPPPTFIELYILISRSEKMNRGVALLLAKNNSVLRSPA